MSWYDIEDEIYTEFNKLKIKYKDDFKIFLPEDLEGLVTEWYSDSWLRKMYNSDNVSDYCEDNPVLIAKVMFNLIYQELILVKMARIVGDKYKAIIKENYPEYKSIIRFEVHSNSFVESMDGRAKLEVCHDRLIFDQPWYQKYNKLYLEGSHWTQIVKALRSSQADLVVNEVPVSIDIADWAYARIIDTIHDVQLNELGSVLKAEFLNKIKEIIAK